MTKIKGDTASSINTSFHFREGTARSYGYNNTFSQLGGIAEDVNGYALVGSSENAFSGAPAPSEKNSSRNIFIQILVKEFKTISSSSTLFTYTII
jgi:hypothetical protein